MKRVFLVIFSIFIFFIISDKVLAITEYRVSVTGVNSITVKRVDSNSSTPSVSDYSSILSYSNGVLTLNEGYYFDFIDIGYNGLTITSNNKKVYINTIGDTTSNSNRGITLDKLYSESYVGSFTPVMYYTYNGRKYLYSAIEVSGNITIKDSNINISIVNSLADQSIQNGNIVSELGDITIENSTIIAEGGPYANSAKTVTAKNSNFNLLNSHDQGATFSSYFGITKIENCIINSDVSVVIYGDEGYIKDSSVVQNNNGFIVSGSATVDNTSVKSLGARIYNRSKTIDVVINNSTFDLKDTFNIGFYRNTSNYIANVILNDSNVTVGEDGTLDIAYSSSLEINNSDVLTPQITSTGGTDTTCLDLNSGTLTTDSIDISGVVDLSNSILNMSEDGLIKSGKELILNHMNDLNIKSIEGGEVNIDSTNVSLSGVLKAVGDVSIKDATINTRGTRVIGDFTISNTYYKTLYLNDENTYSPFIVDGDVDITNTRLIASSDGTVPSVLVTGNITLRDSTFKDNNDKILTVSDIEVSNNNFLSSSSIYGNSEYVSLGDTVKSTTLNGNLSNYSETDGYYEVTIKVVNGIWADGSDETITYKVLLGEDAESNLPNDMIPNKGYTKGDWKLVDGEYVYTFVKKAIMDNPKTGVVSTLGLLLITLVAMFIYLYNKDKYSFFKKI